jgi:hypothetical protein
LKQRMNRCERISKARPSIYNEMRVTSRNEVIGYGSTGQNSGAAARSSEAT